jgi:ABC-type amino acid transport substrate-binding protein
VPGFDIEMAHRMASALQVTLEFFPTVDEAEAADALNAGICDVYMRTLPITPGRTNIFGLTLSVYTSSVGFIVRDYRRREFNYWNSLLARGEELNIAIDASRESQFSARNLLPDATITLLRDMNEQAQLLEKTSNDVDAVMDMAEEGAAWSVMYPQYSVVVPRPAIFVPVAYAVAKGNDDLLAALNAHLLLMKENGFVDQNYEYWMLGGAAKSDRPPRWSVIKDVLKWVD